jgi:hypothetical protein
VPLPDSENDIDSVEDNLSAELSAQLPVTTLQKCDNKSEGYSFLSPALVAYGNSAGETSQECLDTVNDNTLAALISQKLSSFNVFQIIKLRFSAFYFRLTQ